MEPIRAFGAVVGAGVATTVISAIRAVVKMNAVFDTGCVGASSLRDGKARQARARAD